MESREPMPEYEYLKDTLESGKASKEERLQAIHEFLAELDEMRASSAKESEMTDKIYYSKLPVALFHATTKEKAKQITLEGLKPRKLQYEDKKVVSLSDTITYAKFCASVTQDIDPSELVILEITTRGLNRDNTENYLLLENSITPNEKLHEVHSLETVNPDWIHELSSEEIAEIEDTE